MAKFTAFMPSKTFITYRGAKLHVTDLFIVHLADHSRAQKRAERSRKGQL